MGYRLVLLTQEKNETMTTKVNANYTFYKEMDV